MWFLMRQIRLLEGGFQQVTSRILRALQAETVCESGYCRARTGHNFCGFCQPAMSPIEGGISRYAVFPGTFILGDSSMLL
jgi:hypothetical protein